MKTPGSSVKAFNTNAKNLGAAIFKAIEEDDLSALRTAVEKWQAPRFLTEMKRSRVAFRDKDGHSPVTFAARHRKLDALLILHELGVNFDEPDGKQRIAYDIVKDRENSPTKEFLRAPRTYLAMRDAEKGAADWKAKYPNGKPERTHD